jgi:hypothetical protein
VKGTQVYKSQIKGPAAKEIAKLGKEHQRNLAAVAETKGKVTKADIDRETGKRPKPASPSKTLSALAVDLARHVIKDDLVFEKMEALAQQVLEAAGEKI